MNWSHLSFSLESFESLRRHLIKKLESFESCVFCFVNPTSIWQREGSSHSFCNFNLVERGNFPFFLQFQFDRERELSILFCNFNLIERGNFPFFFAISIWQRHNFPFFFAISIWYRQNFPFFFAISIWQSRFCQNKVCCDRNEFVHIWKNLVDHIHVCCMISLSLSLSLDGDSNSNQPT